MLQNRRPAITNRRAVQRQYRRRQSLRHWKGETHGRVFHQRFHRRHTFQRLQPRLRLARLGGLGAKAIHKRLNARAFRYQLYILRLLLRLAFRPNAQEIREIPGIERDAPTIEMRNRIHAAFQQPAIMADHNRRPRKPREPTLQPERRLQIQMVRWFIQQQQIRFQKQGARECHTHAPPTRKFRQRPRLRRSIKTKPGKHRRRARRRTIGTDRNQPFMDLSNPPRISSAIRFHEQCRAFGIRGQNRFQQARRTRRRFLRHMAHARTSREPDLPPIRLQFTHNGTE